MTIKIVLPEGNGVKTVNGTKVFNHEGHEIENISKIEILPIEPDSIIRAKITVAVDSIENFEGVDSLIFYEPLLTRLKRRFMKFLVRI